MLLDRFCRHEPDQVREEGQDLIETLGPVAAKALIGTVAKWGVRAIRGPEEERAVSRVVEEALIATLEQHPEEVGEDVEAWASLLNEFFADPVVCLVLLRAVFRQERPDPNEVRERLEEVDFHADGMPFDFDAFVSEFSAYLGVSAQEEVRRPGSALANRAEHDKLDFVVEGMRVLLSAREAGSKDREAGAVAVGIRSFTRWAEEMEDETDRLLRLEGYFDGRSIRNPELWRSAVYPEMERFLTVNMKERKPYHLHLSAHVSIAFACGYLLDPKSNVDVAPVQRTPSGPELWRPKLGDNGTGGDLWDFCPVSLDRPGKDVAVAIGVTHPVLEDVRAYVERELPQVGRILALTVLPRSAHSSVKDGTHGWRLAEDLAQKIRTERTAEQRKGTLHVFVAAPVGLMFFLGRLSRGFGRCILYEYDLESGDADAYSPSLVFPPETRPEP